MGYGEQGHVRVARIGKPHGIRGEVTVEVFTDSPETRFSPGSVLQLRAVDRTISTFSELTVDKARWNKKILLLQFAEVSDRTTAESLRGSELFTPAEDPLDEEEGWYAEELIGFTVHIENVASSEIGKVSNLITGGVQSLLEVHLREGSKVLVPFVEEIVPEIDEERGTVVITPPPGLLELNQD